MGFEKGKRTGKNWEDVLFIDSLVKNADKKNTGSIMNITGKKEKVFELRFSSILDANKRNLNGKLISQQNKDTTVKQIYCGGKKHRPDMVINDDGIAYLWSKLENRIKNDLIYASKTTSEWNADISFISEKNVLYIYMDYKTI